ncbi:MAG: hypothetical protein MJ198_04470 [Bacteroidales bacterium]|nr:hypothetical protein [Bacteroidales bacterium]
MKKILFIISTYQPVGGHYYSLVETARALSQQYDVLIFNIGENISPIIKNAGIPYSFIYYNKKNFIQVSKFISNYVTKYGISIIHCFDSSSCFVASYAIKNNKNVFFAHTKCGGPIYSKRRLPCVNNLILFSTEDLLYFERMNIKNSLNIKCVPNRVYDFDLDEKRIQALVKKYNLENKRVVLRIGRFSEQYMKATKQIIELVNLLHHEDESFSLLLIGAAKEDSLRTEIEEFAAKYSFVHIECSDIFTANAKELIGIADIVVGTGRGFMEACSKNKIMFVPSDAKKYPVLVSNSNFTDAFFCNFSQRYNDDELCEDGKQLLDKINSYKDSSRVWFDEYFNAESILPRYTEFYKNLKHTHVSMFYLIKAFFAEYIYSVECIVFLYRKIKQK